MGAEGPVRHGTGDELFELVRVADAFLRPPSASVFSMTGMTGSKVVSSWTNPRARKSGVSARAPVSASTIATTVTTPSSARVTRSLRDASVAPPTFMPST